MNNEDNNELPEENTASGNDFYHDDNSFNNQGMNQNSAPVPNQNNSAFENFKGGLAQGVKEGLNPNQKNNPALGGKNKKDDASKKPGDNKKPDNEKRNPLPGGGTNKKADDKKDVSKNPNNQNQNKNSGLMSRFDPRNRKSKKGPKSVATSKASETAGKGLQQGLKAGIQKLWTVLPLQGKIIVIVGSLVLIVLLMLILFISLFGVTTAAVVATMCGESGYGSSSYTIDPEGISFMCSMQDPVEDSNYNVSSLYGWRAYNKSHMHSGIDLAGATGTPILSVHEGTVTYVETGHGVKDGGGYGNHVIIQHGEDGFYTLYGHLSKVNVKKGDKVTQGQQIGKRGDTGNSSGAHLHFEIRKGSSNGGTISPNPYFGYSDEGYDKCLDSTIGYQDNCDLDSSGSARKLGEDGFGQVCGLGGNYSNGGNNSECCETGITTSSGSSDANLQSFLHTFESSGEYCDSAKTKYKAYQNKKDKPTIGYGVTTDYIPGLTAGQCMSVSEVDAAELKAIDVKRTNIKGYFSGVNLTKYEEDAMTSMAYNGCSDFFPNIAKAAADDNYEEIWKAMKGCNNGLDGLKKRRKAEFALFVTGDYSIASEYKEKSWTTAQYNDYDSENIMGLKASGSSSTCVNNTGDKSKVVEIAISELKANEDATKNKKCSSIRDYMKSCGYSSGVHNYCAAFATYVLKAAGVEEDIGLPSYSCKASHFKNTTNGTYHKAGGSFVPEPGDIALHNEKHVMIVEKVEGETVHVIGGNQSPFNVNCPNNGASGSLGNITRASYPIKGGYITGYISYTVSGNSTSSSRTSASKYKSYSKYHKLGTIKISNMKKVAKVTGGSNSTTIAQSMIVANNNYVVAFSNRASSKNAIQTYKMSNGKKKATSYGYFGHANGMAYDSRKDKVYVANLGYYKTVYSFQGSRALEGKNNLNSKQLKLKNNVSTIAYDATTNQIYAATKNNISVYDSNLKFIKKFATKKHNTKQGSGADNGIYYLVEAESMAYPKKASISLYRVADKAYLGTFKVTGNSSYELEAISYTGQGNKFAFLFYVSPGTNYIYTGNINM